MGLLDRIIKWFKDSAERRRFVNEFNQNAVFAFQNLSVDTLLEAKTCSGSPDPTYRHELSAPVAFSGLAVEAKAGTQIPVDDIVLIGRVILSDMALTRRMFLLHLDTLIVRDVRTGRSVDWRIRDFIHFGGLLS